MRYYIYTVLLCAVLICGCEKKDRFIPHDVTSPELDVLSYQYVGQPVRTEQQVVDELKELHKVTPEPYTVGISDRFAFSIYGEANLEVLDVVVRTDGCITLPLIGDIDVAGLTMEQATAKIDERYKKYLLEPRSVLMPKEINSGIYTILGKVTYPNIYPIDRKMYLADAVAKAGGFAVGQFRASTIELADLEHSYIVRDNEVLPVDFVKLIRNHDMLHNIPIKSGDYIYIPSARNQEVYVLGSVLAPDAYGYRDDMTLSHAIANARGFVTGAHITDLRVLRGSLSNPVVYNINYKLVQTGQQLDFKLRPGDIIYVPATALWKWNETVLQILPSIQLLDHAGITNNDDNAN